jgi:hypothetical protein
MKCKCCTNDFVPWTRKRCCKLIKTFCLECCRDGLYRIIFDCVCCNKHVDKWQKSFPSPVKRKFCSPSCKNAREHANGIRRNYIDNSFKNGKTYEELYGIEKAKELRELKSKQTKGKTYEEIHGIELASELRKIRSERFTGEKHPMFGKHHTKETLAKLSLAHLGENNAMYGMFCNIPFRSTFELALLIQSSNERWIEFVTAEPFHIKYELIVNGSVIKHTYTPDFYRSDTKELIEVKPCWKLERNFQSCNEKHEAAKLFCDQNGLKFKIMTENDIADATKISRMTHEQLCKIPGVVMRVKPRSVRTERSGVE